jgi:hypothetical protein
LEFWRKPWKKRYKTRFFPISMGKPRLKHMLYIFYVFLVFAPCACVSNPSRASINRDLPGLDLAVEDAFRRTAPALPVRGRVAVLGVVSANAGEAEYASNELQCLVIKANKYMVLHQKGLSIVNAGTNSNGEIDIGSVGNIGYLLGAHAIVYGHIEHYYEGSFLNIKVIDTLSGLIVGSTTEKFRTG